MKYAFVVPRFGPNVAGGAETLVRELALKLADRGDDVTILTTCAVDNRTWANALTPGIEKDGKLTVHRFPVDNRDLEVWIPKQIAISEGFNLPVSDQLDWMEHSVNSKELYAFIAENSKQFDLLFFAPYLFGTTFWGSLIDPERSVLIPCLHDESYAYLDVTAAMFKEVRGALFNAIPEKTLAERLFGPLRGGEVGKGFEMPDLATVRELQPYFLKNFPYLLYVGRKETGKNVHTLVRSFIEAKQKFPALAPVKLVIAGGGSFDDLYIPDALQSGEIIDLPHTSEEEKQRLIRHALALVQPSLNESFSIVLMEAWMVETPVIVHARCPVTRTHVIDSGGGLYFDGADELGVVVSELLTNSDLARTLGASGREYVSRQYSWEAVLDRFDAVRGVLNG